jgi:ligand-binding sensor domain-containing protein
MKRSKFASLCFLMLVLALNVNAQFTNYDTINSDLPSNYVCGGVAIDTNNNVWVGTDAGVAKFDGTNWTVYTTANGLPVNIIACISVDNSNNIWIGTDGDGVAKFNGSTWTTYTIADGLCDNGVHSIACDADSSIWFGSWGAGVSKLHDTTWTTYTDADGIPNDGGAIASIYYIYVDASNNKWFGTDLGLVKYNNTVFTTFNQTTTPNLKSNSITAVAVDDNNNKWLGVLAKGIAKLNSSDAWVANYDTITGICNDGITDVIIDSDGDLWFGEYTKYGSLIKGGITKFNSISGTGISLRETDGLVNEQVFRIAADKDDALWVATGDGLSKYIDQIGIQENSRNLALDIYPNPAHETLKINGSIQSGVAVISDITGRIIFNQTVSSPVTINIENFVSGIYFIKIAENEKMYFGKFIKE